MRQRAVTQGKAAQLKRCFIALGVYLRRFFLNAVDKENVSMDTLGFGKFTIVNDPDADDDSLYPKKL